MLWSKCNYCCFHLLSEIIVNIVSQSEIGRERVLKSYLLLGNSAIILIPEFPSWVGHKL